MPHLTEMSDLFIKRHSCYLILIFFCHSYLTMLIWKSFSPRSFQAPERKSRHQANALPLVSRSTSSVLPSGKDSSESESSSQSASHGGLCVLCFWLTTSALPSRFFSAVSVSSVVAGTVLKSFTLYAAFESPSPELSVTFRRECIVSLCAKSKKEAVCNDGIKQEEDLAEGYGRPVQFFIQKSLVLLNSARM